MDHSTSSLLPVARGLGLAGAGLILGLQSSIPLFIYPALYTVKTLSPRDRLHLWSKTFDAGKASMLTLIPLTTVTLVRLGSPPFFISSELLFCQGSLVIPHLSRDRL